MNILLWTALKLVIFALSGTALAVYSCYPFMSKFVYFLTYLSFYVYLCKELMVASVARFPKRQHIARFNSFANSLGASLPLFYYIDFLPYYFLLLLQ